MDSPGARRTNLPAELSSFVGRRHELGQLRSALRQHRLVTLFGPGGVGKTRLALRAAAELSKQYAEGAWVAGLANVTDPGLVPDTVVAALGLRGGSAAPATEVLVAHLRSREMLLVLDNCEHLEEAAAALVDRLLAACPRLKVITTSRHALQLPDEHLLPVPPLSVPAPDRGARSPEGLLGYDAVRLFVDRATASWASFEVTEANEEPLAELVRHLDGMPLAIELASVRVRSLSVQQILERLVDRFTLLSRGSRTATPRQQTLRALIDWSHDLLDEAERLVWMRTTVFSGTFDLPAARAVVCDDSIPTCDVRRLLDSLVTKSILVREDGGGLDGDSAVRFRMLETIKEYGLGRLGDAGRSRFSQRHLEHYAGLAETAAREMFGPCGVGWFRRLRADHDNIRLALEHCAADPDRAAAGVRMMGSLLHYWVMVGRFSEGRRWLERLLEHPKIPALDRAAGLVVAGRLAVLQGDVEVGRPLLEQALGKATLSGSTTWRGHALHGLALTSVFWAEPKEAVVRLEEALALHRLGEDPFGVPLALVQLATVHATLGEPERALACAEECIQLSGAAGEQWCAALARWTEALVAWRQGRPSRARSHAREVLRLKEPFGDRLGMAMSMEMIAWTWAVEGRSAEAARLLGAVDAALASIGGALFRHLLEDHEHTLDRLREQLGDELLARAVDEGAALDFDDAIGLALGRRQAAGHTGAGGPAHPQLTRREAQIARLVAEGLTNKEIAARLVMATRTAEGHVARVLAKLGLSSRTQLSAWVAEHLTST
jgi:predicted ATPase/DNA-binding CsgD family transcriptional regulator